MCKKLAFLVCVIVVLGLVGKASAATKTWTGNGDGTNWCDAGNWSGGVPILGDTALLDGTPSLGPTIGVGCDANVSALNGPCWIEHGAPYGTTQNIDITGGTLTVHGIWHIDDVDDKAGNGHATVNISGDSVVEVEGEIRGQDGEDGNTVINISDTADVYVQGMIRGAENEGGWFEFNMSGGDVNCGGIAARDDGSGRISITGGNLICRGDIEIRATNGTAEFTLDGGAYVEVRDGFGCPSDDSGTGTVNLNSGTLICGSFNPDGNDWNLDIEEGVTWIINGSHKETIEAHIDANRITGKDNTETPSVVEFIGYTQVGFNLVQEKAYSPSPQNNTGNICPDSVTISWTPGTLCVDDHNVYFGTSEDDVNESTTPYEAHWGSNSITLINLEVGTAYFWRVDEVNDTDGNSPWKGSVWQFGTEGGAASDPSPVGRGLKVEDVDLLSWSTHCIADAHNVYFATDLPASIVLFDDDFESGAFDPNWTASSSWEIFDVNGDPNFDGRDANMAKATSSGDLITADVDATEGDPCAINISFYFRKTEEITNGEIKLYYYDGSNWDYIADLNSNPEGANDVWLHYSDTNSDSQYFVSTFKIKLEANITGGTVYIDDVTITNTWPTAAQWYQDQVAEANYPISVEPMTVYRWRVDTVIDGNVYQGPHWKFSTGYGGLLMYYKFDGTNPFPSPIQDDSDNDIEFYKYTDGGGSVTYGESNPVFAASTASADFDPNAGLYRLDPCGPSEDTRDILRLDGDYTVEMWVMPRSIPTDEDNPKVYLISKRDAWGLAIHGGNNNNFRGVWASGGSTDDDTVEENKWYHVALVYAQDDPEEEISNIYINGVDAGDAGGLPPADNNNPIWIGANQLADGNLEGHFDGMIDEIRIHDIALRPCAFLVFQGAPEYASCPIPYDGEGEIDPCTVELIWTPGEGVVSHDIYFSSNFDDVNNPSATPVETGHVPSSWTPTTLPLSDGTVYYWRIDSNDGSPPLYQGPVWKFTTKYVVEDANLILHYKFDEVSGDDAIDASGHGYHGDVDGEDNWEPAGGHFDGCLLFDDDTSVEPPTTVTTNLTNQVSISVWLNGLEDQRVSDHDQTVLDVSTGSDANYAMRVLVPNEDGDVLWRAGNDTNDTLVWYDATPAGWRGDWHHLVFIKDESAGTMSIYFDTEVVEQKAGAISSLSNIVGNPFEIGDDDYEGRMDDLRIYKKAISKSKVEKLFRGEDVGVAWGPSPYDGQPDVHPDANLFWKPGKYAADTNGHEVYFGTNRQDVEDANNSWDVGTTVYKGNQGPNTYDPCLLESGQTYYWRIDEVNDACDPNGWRGNLWRFTVASYIVIDDFEKYDTGDASAQPGSWEDGTEDPWETGSGIEFGDLGWGAEKVRSGKMSMWYWYDNDFGGTLGYYSEAATEALSPTDWASFVDLKVLTLWFYGDPDNAATYLEQMYVGLKDTSDQYAYVDYGEGEGEDMSDIQIEEWQRWDIPLSSFTDVNRADVEKLIIGFGDRDNTTTSGGDGVVYFDDIWLHMAFCDPVRRPLEGDLNGDCAVDFEDVEIMAIGWLDSDCNCIEEYGEMPPPQGDANLVAWYELDDGSGDTATDSSSNPSNGYDGTVSVNDVDVFWTAPGYDDTGYALDFYGGWVSVPNGPTKLNLTDAVTVCAWINLAGSVDDGVKIVVKGRDDWETYALEVSDENRGRFFVRDANDRDNQYTIDSSDELPVNSWVHVAGTYDGNELTLYVNGRVAANSVHPLWEKLAADANDGLGIAGRWDDTGGRFIGTIDDVRIYDYGLSGGEICYIASDGDGVAEMVNIANIHVDTPEGTKQAVNFKDFAKLANNWRLKEIYWPED